MCRMETYKKQLIESGLSENQALIYELLIKNGPLRASSIVRRLGNTLSRPMVYMVLGELISLGLLEKDELSSKVARFVPLHPTKLHDLAQAKKAEVEAFANAAALLIPKIVSEYNLHSNKPGVRFFEGAAGVEQVLFETLRNTEEVIYTYADTEAIAKYVKEINERYVIERRRLGVKKKILMIDSPSARERAKQTDGLTEIRIIPAPQAPSVPAVIEIHNDTVTYITFANDVLTATVINDATIYALHRFLFESQWDRLVTPDA